MSNTERRPYAHALTVASTVVEALRPHCHRIEIAGSLRRQKETIGDIEICAIPILHTNLIGEAMETSQVDDLLTRWPIALHKNGHKFKQFSFEWQPGWTFKVDLFLQPDPATWGWNCMIRTGNMDFSKRMVTPRAFGGYKPEWATVKGARVWRDGAALPTPEEADVFNAFGLHYVEPRDRA